MRLSVATMKISHEIERIGESHSPLFLKKPPSIIFMKSPKWQRLLKQCLKYALTVFAEFDQEKKEYMDPGPWRWINCMGKTTNLPKYGGKGRSMASTKELFISKSIERVADHERTPRKEAVLWQPPGCTTCT